MRIVLDAELAARAPRRARARGRRRAHRRRPPQPGVRGTARREQRRSGGRGARVRPADRRRPARLAARRAGRRARGDIRCRRSARRADRPRRGRARGSSSGSGRRRRTRSRPVSARHVSCGLRPRPASALFLVITSGAFVRLTGSGLGCDNWPRCGDKPYPGAGLPRVRRVREPDGRARRDRLTLVTLARVAPSRRAVRAGDGWAALGAFLGTVAQIPLGGITIALDLHPLAVMSHFLLALVVVRARARRRARGVEPARRARARRPAPSGSGCSSPASVSPPCVALVVTGAVATASGPHPGSSEDVERLGLGIVDTVYVHVRVAAVFGIGVLVVGWLLCAAARELPGLAPRLGAVCSSCSSRR